ncbi:protein tyrosine phosphatase type IVA 2-like [Panonychus citri]|uniref:protein tyrosine phosphatase type IVA 2-like n=1 Tax=Panonychus citri TaxID=50023 RepID=UPI00230704FF|nr:protein tyrosine phosphatase type IVA 2-like [Panonychus citri]
MKQKDSISSIISPLVRPGPSDISYKDMRFLIMDRPTDNTLNNFIEELKKRNIRDVVRVCEPTYRTDLLEKEGINVHDWQFDDGSPPPQHVVEQWFDLLRTRFREDPNNCIAVHCVAGLGRAPVLVALALIELGMQYEDAIDLIRQKRRGAINARQLSYLAEYRPKSRLKTKLRQTHKCLLH